MSGNTAKYLSYTAAWQRIRAATDAGFYLEVVTLCESMISDRLLSYAHAMAPERSVGMKTRLRQLIGLWRKHAGTLPMHRDVDLGEAVDRWRDSRNKLIHSMVKSEPGGPTENVASFLDRAKTAAEDGAVLARAVLKWDRAQRRRH